MTRHIATLLLALVSGAAFAGLPGFTAGPFAGEQVRQERTESGVRILSNAPGEMRADLPTTVIIYGTPNGSTAEQTLGCRLEPGLDWHFDIQHVAAQTRLLRAVDRTRNIVLVCMQPDIRSWPTWRQRHPDASAIIRELVENAIKGVRGTEVDVIITGHSGGGSMINGFIDAYDAVPSWVSRIAYLDANYSYSDTAKHGDKLLAWLKSNPQSRLVVIAYDDRSITLDGKPVVTTGGTFRASHRMLSRFEQDGKVDRSKLGDFDRYDALGCRINMLIHRNPQNKILHTRLVGEMNGYIHAVALGTAFESRWGTFGGPRAYTKWVQPADASVMPIPARPKNAEGGASVMKRVSKLPREEREAVLRAEIEKGNMPDFLRSFITIKVEGTDATGKKHTASYQVMPDYLSVGSDTDFVRVPLTPKTAQPIADKFACILPTRKMVDDIHTQSTLKLEPKPLIQDRESLDTFVQHSSIIEAQRAGKPLGQLVSGIKKDVVITNLLAKKPNRVAIYGWHKLDGEPIQPLTTVHVDWYVDYSHGVRLVKREVIVDGVRCDARDILKDPVLSFLFSDEGPITAQY